MSEDGTHTPDEQDLTVDLTLDRPAHPASGPDLDLDLDPDLDPALADRLRRMWDLADPVPTGLLERVGFALQLEEVLGDDLELELELMRLTQEQTSTAGARGADEVRSVTFGSETLTVMLAISDTEGGFRIDGWVAPGGRRSIEVRTSGGTRSESCDETGRFQLGLVPAGHLQLVLALGQAAGAPARAVVTPALTL